MSLFEIYEKSAALYEGSAKSIEELYLEIAGTTTWSWKEIKDYTYFRESKIGREKKVQKEWVAVYVKPSGRGRNRTPGYWSWEIKDVYYELKPDRNYDDVIFSKLFLEFRVYINAMINKYRDSMEPEQVIFEAQQDLCWAIDGYVPGRITYSKKTGKAHKTSLAQTFQWIFSNHLAGQCQNSSRLKRTGKEDLWDKTKDPEQEKKDNPAIITNSLDTMLDTEDSSIPRTELAVQLVEDKVNLSQALSFIIMKIESKKMRDEAIKILDDFFNANIKIPNNRTSKFLKNLIAENKERFYRQDLIST